MKMMMKKVENIVDDGGGEDYPGHLPRAETLASRIALCLCPEASLWSFLRISSMFFFLCEESKSREPLMNRTRNVCVPLVMSHSQAAANDDVPQQVEEKPDVLHSL